MDRLTGILVGLAVGLGLLAARDARRAKKADRLSPATQPPAPRADASGARSIDPGMVIVRNDHIDDGMVVRSPFNGDPGMTDHGRRTTDNGSPGLRAES